MANNDKIKSLIYEYLPEGKTFVEIGAYDGETYSNTCHLADAGWTGYYFEPVLEYAEKCRKRHIKNKVTVFPVAVGKPGIWGYYVSGLLSTFGDKEYQDKVAQMEWFKGITFKKKTQVACISPSEIPECDLLVIDVEGSEEYIIENMTVRPKMIVVELHEDSKPWQEAVYTKNSIAMLEGMGYTKVYKDDVDSVFIYEN